MTSSATTSATPNSTPPKTYTQTLPSRKPPTPPKLLFTSLSMRSRVNPSVNAPDGRTTTNDESTPVLPMQAPTPKAAISRRASASLLIQKTKHILRAGLHKTATLGSFQRWQDIKGRKGEREREREKVQWANLTLDEKILGPVIDIGHGHGCYMGGGDEMEYERGRRANGVQALFEIPGPVRTGGEEEMAESGKLKEGEEVESEHPIGDGKGLGARDD